MQPYKFYTLTILRLLFCFLLTSSLCAQTLQVSPSTLQFGTKSELETDSLPVQLSNSGQQPLSLKLRIPFRVYGSQPYSIRDSVFSLAGGESKTIFVRCRILHNTANDAALLIESPWQEPGGDHAVLLQCQGRYSMNYYDASQNLEEEALKQSLKSITGNNYNGYSYDVARDKMYGSIDNHNDSVTCIYTGRKARFNTRAGAGTNNFNCEHTFPQSFFSQNLPMRSDLHHLFSTDDAANNSRGNLPFGTAVPPLVAEAVNAPSKNGGGHYEPRDQQKGATARAMIYFVNRYEDYGGFFAPQQAILRSWHRQFPPSAEEKARNQAIFAEQANRNPFVDYPQLADRIHDFIAASQAVQEKKLRISDDVLYSPADITASQAAFSLLLWNEGNQPVQVQNIRFRHRRLRCTGSNNLSVAGNSATEIHIQWNPDSVLSDASADSLLFETDDPQHNSVVIPWIRQPFTSVAARQLNHQFILAGDEEKTCFRVLNGRQETKSSYSLEAVDVTGRKQVLEEISEGRYRIQQGKPGLYFIIFRNAGFSQRLPFFLKP